MERTKFKRLFEPISIGKMQSKNRIVMPPMGTGYAAEGGYVSQRLIDYYVARAKGGVGVIIVEGAAVDVQCSGIGSQLSIGDESYIAGLSQLVKAIHEYGAKAALQIYHAGLEIKEGQLVQIAPSPVVVPARMVGISGQPTHELSIDEIGQRVLWFTAAAKRAREAGFDGVEIHGAHLNPLASFLSSATNMREDRYGGTAENKARFLIEIIQAIREEVGSDYPVWPRLNAHEYGVDKGVTIEETKKIVPLLIDVGAQAIHVSAYGAGSYATKAPMSDTPGFLVPLAEEIRKVTKIPLITVGRLGPEIGEQILEEGKADLIAMGRRLMADPDLPTKVAGGRLDEINPCIACMECNERSRVEGEGVRCTINAAMGREREHHIELVAKTKRVVVAGGGPAGMEAARLAAQRGHHVLLFERELRLGGLLNPAALPSHKGDIESWVRYLTSQVKKAGVELRLGTSANPELLRECNPDAVIIAVGGVPIIPAIAGIDRPNVVPAQEVLAGKKEVGSNVAIIGGGMVGCETGHYLAGRGKRVVIIEALGRVATDMGPMVRRRLLDGLRGNQVTMLTGTTCEEITEVGVTVNTGEGKKESIQADTVILAAGYQKNDDLYKILKSTVPEIYCIGDSAEPRRIMEAIDDGYRVGLSL